MVNNYFPHDSNARNSDKLIPVRMKHGAEGYGIYFMILERLREETDYMSVKDYNTLAFDLRVDTSKVKSIVEEFGLFVFTDDGKYFYSESFAKRMEIKDEKSKLRSEAGKKGAQKRWGNKKNSNSNDNANSKANDKNSNAIANEQKNIARKGKETKGKESKENNTTTSSGDSPSEEFNALQDFETLWLFPNQFQLQDLNDLIDQHGKELTSAAIRLAGTKDVVKGKAINFLKAVLKEWAENHVTNTEQVAAYQAKRDQKQKKQYSKPAGRTESMPDWANEENKGEEIDYEKQEEFRKRLERIRNRRKVNQEG